MNKLRVLSSGLIAVLLVLLALSAAAGPGRENADAIPLPDPDTSGGSSLAWTLQNRHAARDFLPGSIRLQALVQLLWAAQGETDRTTTRRAAPSFNNLYPLSVYVLAGNVERLNGGCYQYLPEDHALRRMTLDDLREPLAQSLREQWIANAPVVLIFAGDYERAAQRLGKNSARYVDIELGHAAQNVYLQATALHVGTIFFAIFDHKKINALLNLSPQELPVGIMPVGPIP